MTDLSVRRATPDDAGQIAALHIDSFVASYGHLPITRRSAEQGRHRRERLWANRIGAPDDGSTILVATHSGRIWGFIHLGPTTDSDDSSSVGHIFSLHVLPKQTGRGIGTALMAHALRSLTQAGFEAATLWVVADNENARRFYERLGWSEDGERHWETLGFGDEEGDVVEVVRYRLDHPSESWDEL